MSELALALYLHALLPWWSFVSLYLNKGPALYIWLGWNTSRGQIADVFYVVFFLPGTTVLFNLRYNSLEELLFVP